MSRRNDRNRDRRSNSRKSTRITPRAPKTDYRSWPIVRAYVPQPDAWRVSGFGAAGIVRQQPDGKMTSAFFSFSVIDAGVTLMWGDENKTLEEIETTLADFRGKLPPVEVGDPDAVSRFVWGAYALGLWAGAQWPPEKTARFLAMVPPLSGTRNWWFQQFVGENGLVPPRLWNYILPLIDQYDRVPRGKEPAVATFMLLGGIDPAAARAAITARPADFEESDTSTAETPVYFWMRERTAAPGQRVPHGSIVLEKDRIDAHAATLSLASIFLTYLREMLGPNLQLLDVQWRSPATLGFNPPGLTRI